MSDERRTNPYVGLRPFFVEDTLYFYGREQQVAELLGILRQHRFLSVVGSSGSGKSSLVRAGLQPGLLGGFLVHDRDRWRTVQIKPGDAPIGNLAAGMVKAMQRPAQEAAVLEQSIRDGHTDAAIAFLAAHLDERTNVFILVDQFEEIFAFRGGSDDADAGVKDVAWRKARALRRAEAADFVDLLLRLAEHRELPIYIALTMRTDFLGECDLFYGLPEALNRGRYLVPRLTREQLRDAVECPALILGAEVAPRLLDHVLNELGDRDDRLPVLQHALLRTWDEWRKAGSDGPIDVIHYQRAGGLERALDLDAEDALQGLDREATARVFKRLTATDASQRRVRNPARISELMAASEAGRDDVMGILQRFAAEGRNFVFLSADGRPEDPRADISHESLIRQWSTLRTWVDEERVSSDVYKDLLVRSRKHAEGRVALLVDPELRIVFDWRAKEGPSAAWAERYSRADNDFESAMGYLDASVAARSVELGEKVLGQRWRMKWAPSIAVMLVAAAVIGYFMQLHDRLSFLVPDPEPPDVLQVPEIPFVTIRGLTWTTTDSRRTVNYEQALKHCAGLPSLSGSYEPGLGFWRLPTAAQLKDIYAPGDVANGLGRKLRAEFQGGVTADRVWARPDERESPGTDATLVDFKLEQILQAPQHVGDVATALCVSSEPHTFAQAREAAATAVERATRGSQLILGLLYAGAFVAAYFIISPLARWLQRRLTFNTLERRFASGGGRDPGVPDDVDALAALQTRYASTWRRLAAWWVDLSLYGTAVAAAAFAFVVIAESRVIVERPDGTVAIAKMLQRYGSRAAVLMPDGTVMDLPEPPIEPERIELSEDGRLLLGRRPRSRDAQTNPSIWDTRLVQPLVLQKTPDGEQWFGTIGPTARDRRSYSLEFTFEQWMLTREVWLDDLRWRFGADAAAIDAEEQSWLQAHPAPDAGTTGSKSFPLAGHTWRYDDDAKWRRLYISLALAAVAGWLYIALSVASRARATLGMWIAGIIRTDLRGARLSFEQTNAWLVSRVASYFTLGLGFLLQPFTSRRQTLHDRIAQTVVLRRPPGMPARFQPLRANASLVLGLWALVFPMVLPGYASYIAARIDGPGADSSFPASDWQGRWDDVGVDLHHNVAVEGTVDNPNERARFHPQAWPVAQGSRITVKIDSTLTIEPPPRCPDRGCPVAFAYGLMEAVTPMSPDLDPENTSALTMLGVSPCDVPAAHASGSARQEPFQRDLTFTVPSRLGLYRLWVDFPKIFGCGPDDITVSDPRELVLLEVLK